MKRVLHLVRFDLESMSPVLGVWAGVLLLQATVLWMGPPIPVTGQRPEMEISLDIAAIVMRFAVTAVLMVLLAQRHLLVGTTAFWRTRPMPRVSVLASTFISGILLTVVVPWLWFVGVFVWMGIDRPAAVRGAMAIAGEQALFAGLALALASVSANLAQVVVLGVVTMLVYALGLQLVAGIPRQPPPFTIVYAAATWIGIMFWTVLGTVATLISAHQHLTLKTTRSRALIAVAVVSIVLLRPFPLWTFTVVLPDADATTTVQTPGLSLDPASMRVENYSRTTPEGSDAGIRQSALLTQSPSVGPIMLKPLKAVSVLAFPDGVSLRVSPRFVDAWTEDIGEPILADTPYPGLANAIGAILADPPLATAGRYWVTFLDVREDVYAARATQPAVLDVTLDLQVYRHAIAARVPLDVGSQARSPGYIVEFVGTASFDGGIAVDIRETYVKEWRSVAPTYYVLRNRRLNQAVLATNRWERLFRSAALDYSSLVVSATRLGIQAHANDARRLTLDRAWLADAELLVLKPEVLGRISKSIRINDYTLAPPAMPPLRP